MTNYNIVQIPIRRDEFGVLVMGQVLVSDAMLPVLFEHIQRLSVNAQREIVEVPYLGPRDSTMDAYVTRHLHTELMHKAFEAKRSVVAMGPVHWAPDVNSFGGRGTAYIEYTHVPMADLKESNRD